MPTLVNNEGFLLPRVGVVKDDTLHTNRRAITAMQRRFRWLNFAIVPTNEGYEGVDFWLRAQRYDTFFMSQSFAETTIRNHYILLMFTKQHCTVTAISYKRCHQQNIEVLT